MKPEKSAGKSVGRALAKSTAAMLLVGAHSAAFAASTTFATIAEPRSTLDGFTRASGVQAWLEISEPGSFGLLLLGIAGLIVGRWAARHKRKDPPRK